ncbi:MAG: ABC transporter ATP-binding protein [Pseudomonadota bacterium]
MAGIALTTITKSFGPTPVLRGIDLDIRDGEFLTLVGPSGCGKSTLLRIIAGLESQDSGDVQLGDRLVNDVRPAERNLAMVFQSYALYPHLTVAENMKVPLRLRQLGFFERFPILGPLISGDKHRALDAAVSETAGILKIEQLLNRKPGQLSGGQRQRAALGRAMVRAPVAFLMDEPLSNLDAALRVHMRAELSELHRSLGATFVYVTHDQAEALTMSDRMAVMMGGEILQLDRPELVYEDPNDLRVAEFIGSPKINVLEGRADASGAITAAGVTLEDRIDAGTAPALKIGIRPEHLTLLPAPGEGVFSGQIVHRENLGADLFIHMDLGPTRMIVRCDPSEIQALEPGQTAHAVPQRGRALFFGADGTRIRPGAPVAPAVAAQVA